MHDYLIKRDLKPKAQRFEKTVRYVTRKARADVRKRVKRRFEKAGDAYDYDPMSQTRSYSEYIHFLIIYNMHEE
ncbi:hypothetical protein M8C21_021496, partial [Ambrosia artemisiifolia]